MDAEARLVAALGGSAAPVRDPGFTLAVIRAAEADRFKTETARSMLSAGAVAAATACLALFLAGWTSLNWQGVQVGVLGAGGIFALVAMTRLVTQRLAPAVIR